MAVVGKNDSVSGMHEVALRKISTQSMRLQTGARKALRRQGRAKLGCARRPPVSYTSHQMYRGGWPDKGPRSSAVRPAGDTYRVSAAGQVERARCTCERHR